MSAPRNKQVSVGSPAGRKTPTYTTICVSTYRRDLAELDAKVAALKARGYTRANRSQLIRLAVSRLDVDQFTGAVDTVPSLEPEVLA